MDEGLAESTAIDVGAGLNLDYPADLLASVAMVVAGLHFASMTTLIVGYSLLAFTVMTPNVRSLIQLLRSRPTDRR